MALAETMLVSALKADAGFGALAGDGIYPIGGTSGKPLPHATYQRISTTGTGHLTGGGTTDQVRMQISCWAATALAALELAASVRDCIEPAEGEAIGIFITQQGAALDEDTRQWGVSSDYFIWQERN